MTEVLAHAVKRENKGVSMHFATGLRLLMGRDSRVYLLSPCHGFRPVGMWRISETQWACPRCRTPVLPRTLMPVGTLEDGRLLEARLSYYTDPLTAELWRMDFLAALAGVYEAMVNGLPLPEAPLSELPSYEPFLAP